MELSERCAEIIRNEASADIPPDLVKATVGTAALILGIKEAYLYRDWQAAVGDLMLFQTTIGNRHFSVLGFGSFEDMVLEAQNNKDASNARWFERLEAIIHDLDMAHHGIFDARREQLQKLHRCCKELEAGLEDRVKTGS